MNKLEELIRRYANLNPETPNGWCTTLCKVCNDAGRKGPRAGFKFDNHSIVYNCFNCGISGSYTTNDKVLSDHMSQIVAAYDIPEFEINNVLFQNNTTTPIPTDQNPTNTYPSTIKLLDCFYPLTDDANDDWCQYSIQYLSERQVDWKSQPFYCVKYPNNKALNKWFGRLIIPIYYNNEVVFYQGRDLTDSAQLKYISPAVNRSNILYGYHNIEEKSNECLFVVEGWFDAVNLNGVAIFGNKLTQQQINLLNRTNRTKVVIPDRHGNGQLLANQALSLGWKISTLDLNDDCKDVSASIQKHGMLFTIRSLYNNICEGSHARIVTNLYCKR